MNGIRLFGALMLLALSGCSQTPKLVATAPAPTETVTGAPRVLTPAAAAPMVEPAAFAQAQANLRALGYPVGKANDPADPVFQRGLSSFQRDQGLPEDGQLTLQMVEKLRLVRAALRGPVAPPAGVFVYSGRQGHQALTLASPPEGFASDASANFLMPLRPGSQAILHLTRKDASPIVITCRTGKLGTSNLPLGAFETVAVDCRGEGANDPQWHDLFSPRLSLVVQRKWGTVTRDLIALRPVAAAWPMAVRTGLDWAISSALDEPAATGSVQWSSTAVAPRFDIKVTGRIKGGEAGLGKAYATATCRRFDLVQTAAKASYPGIACQDGAGDWVLPASGIAIARPAGNTRASAPSLRSAAK